MTPVDQNQMVLTNEHPTVEPRVTDNKFRNIEHIGVLDEVYQTLVNIKIPKETCESLKMAIKGLKRNDIQRYYEIGKLEGQLAKGAIRGKRKKS